MTRLQGEEWVPAVRDVSKTATFRPASLERGRFRWHVRARAASGVVGAWSEWRVLTVY
jgi:hypothetical protein